jgi:hypothetical protein
MSFDESIQSKILKDLKDENEVEVYLDFSGWIRLSPNTRMEYLGEDESKAPIITISQWFKLSKNEQDLYILEDFVSAYRDAEDCELDTDFWFAPDLLR